MAYIGNGNYSKIEQEGHRDEILKMVIDNVPYKDIASKFGYSKDTVARYVKDRLRREAAIERSKNRKKLTADFSSTMDYLQGVNQKVIEACEDWMRKPHSSKFTLEPRADELSVIYTETVIDENGKPRQKRNEALLQDLLDIALTPREKTAEENKDDDSNPLPEPKKTIQSVKYIRLDPRTIILTALGEARKQTELIAKVTGDLNSLADRTDIYGVVVPLIIKAIIDETRGNAPLRKKLIEAIEGNLAIAEEETIR